MVVGDGVEGKMMNELPQGWTPKLTPKRRANYEKWVADLETTEAGQCEMLLTDGAGFCCLGRAYVALESQPAQDPLPSATFGKRFGWPADEDGDVNCPVPEGRYRGVYAGDASALNDFCHLAFKEIAQVVRWAYLGGPRPHFYEEVVR
jgi:hypothetical protein